MSVETPSKGISLSVEDALNYGVSKPRFSGIWKLVLTVGILFYLIPVLYWLFRDLPSKSFVPPASSVLKGQLERVSMRCMIACGSVQCWSVFSPNVNHTIYHETAIITFKDGTSKIYEFPRMAKLSYYERFKHEKLRKIFGDCIPWPGYEPFLPSVSQYLALSNSNSANPPIMLFLEKNHNENPKPDPKNWNYRDKLPWHTNKTMTFVYGVRKNDLISGPIDQGRTNPRIYEDQSETNSQGGTI